MESSRITSAKSTSQSPPSNTPRKRTVAVKTGVQDRRGRDEYSPAYRRGERRRTRALLVMSFMNTAAIVLHPRQNRATPEVTLMVLRRTIISKSSGQWESVKMAVEEYIRWVENVHLSKEVKKMVVGMADTRRETTIPKYAESFYRITERQANGDGRSCPTYTLALFFQGACKPTPSSPALSRPGTRCNTEIRAWYGASIVDSKDHI